MYIYIYIYIYVVFYTRKFCANIQYISSMRGITSPRKINDPDFYFVDQQVS